MDGIYYVSGVLMTIVFCVLLLLLAACLIKPHLLNKNKHITGPVPRLKILFVGMGAMVLTLFGFGSVLAATEPASVKQERITREATALKAEQDKKAADEKAKAAAAEAERKSREDTKRPVIKTETKIEAVPFTTSERQDGMLAKGQTRVTEGVAGERTVTYEVTYIEGKETARNEIKSDITKRPVEKVVRIGAYQEPSTPPPTPSQVSVYYKNCSAARAAGVTPLYRGEAGYAKHLDSDDDGIACE